MSGRGGCKELKFNSNPGFRGTPVSALVRGQVPGLPRLERLLSSTPVSPIPVF